MMGIMIMDSADNLIEDNEIWDIDPKGAGCGIHVQGSLSSRNTIRRNHAHGNTYAGIMIRSAGTDNLVLENVVSSNGQFGITNWSANGTRIEGNLSNQNPGRFSGPAQVIREAGLGIDLRTSTSLTVKDNSVFKNTGFDFYWDNSGTNKFLDNPGLKSLSALKLSNTSNAARNPAFLSGDSFRVEVNGAPANTPVYLRLFKDGKDLGVSGPYGSANSAGGWSFAGTFDASAGGSWFVQALFGSPDSTHQSGVLSLSVK
jgi:parallel beta-helix repeat protein